MLKSTLAASAALVLLGLCQAQADTEPLRVELLAHMITVDDSGHEHMTPADAVEPGSLIEYTMTYENVSNAELDGFIINGRIPEMTDFIGGSANTDQPARFEVRVADIGWSEVPVTRYLPDETGVLRAVIVPPKEYTGLRWRLDEPLASGEVIEAHYRVIVDQ